MPSADRITVLAFGSAAEVLGWPERDFPLDPHATLATLIARLERECPRLIEGRDRLKYAVNQRYATPDTPLSPGDEVAVIPPVSGGAPEPARAPLVRLVREPIDLPTLLAEVAAPAVGGVASFLGVVRFERDAAGRALHALDYHAYEPMALAEMERLAAAAAAAHELHRVAVVHRLGLLPIGEASIAVVAAAPHRAAAFDACRALIEAVKASAPIFKKEIWAEGPATWVDPL